VKGIIIINAAAAAVAAAAAAAAATTTTTTTTTTTFFSYRNFLHFDSLSKSVNRRLLVMVYQFLQTSCTTSEIGNAAQLACSIARKACMQCTLGKYIAETSEMLTGCPLPF